MLLRAHISYSAQSGQGGCQRSHADSEEMRRITVDFRINSWEIDSSYSDNSLHLRELQNLVGAARENPVMSLDTLRVSGLASPDGYLPKNKELSRLRAEALSDYLRENCGVPDSLIRFGENRVSWQLFRDLIDNSEYEWRDEAMRIMAVGDDESTVDNTRRMNRLKRLAGGKAWKSLRLDIFPKLRSAYIITAVVSLAPPDAEEQASEGPDTDSKAFEDIPDNEGATEMETLQSPLESASYNVRDYDRFAIKTNAAYLAAGVSNLGVEMAVAPHWSVDIPLVYSPYTIAQTYRMRFLYVQPEARYWLDRPMRGHFFGIHAHAGVGNVAFCRDKRYQTPGGFYGGGVSYGYSLPLARRWSIEFTIGAGYFFTKYDAYDNSKGVSQGSLCEKGRVVNYWGIDKVGINIVYRFGDKSGSRGSRGGKEVEWK